MAVAYFVETRSPAWVLRINLDLCTNLNLSVSTGPRWMPQPPIVACPIRLKSSLPASGF